MAKRKRSPLKERLRVLAEELAQFGHLNEEERKQHYESKHKGKRLLDLAFALDDARGVKDYLDRLSTFANAEVDALRLVLIPGKMEEEGIENLTIEELGRLGLSADLYVSIKSGKKEDFFRWLNKHNLGDLIQDTVNPSTLKSFVKGRMAAGKEIPGDLLNVTPYTRASITKA